MLDLDGLLEDRIDLQMRVAHLRARTENQYALPELLNQLTYVALGQRGHLTATLARFAFEAAREYSTHPNFSRIGRNVREANLITMVLGHGTQVNMAPLSRAPRPRPPVSSSSSGVSSDSDAADDVEDEEEEGDEEDPDINEDSSSFESAEFVEEAEDSDDASDNE